MFFKRQTIVHQLEGLVAHHREAFANNDEEVGTTSTAIFNLDLTDRNPVTSGRARRVPYQLRPQLDKKINDLESELEMERTTKPPVETPAKKK